MGTAASLPASPPLALRCITRPGLNIPSLLPMGTGGLLRQVLPTGTKRRVRPSHLTKWPRAATHREFTPDGKALRRLRLGVPRFSTLARKRFGKNAARTPLSP
jgi:hypothetical protein